MKEVYEHLKELIDKQCLPHALLFCGEEKSVQKGIDTLIGHLLEKRAPHQIEKWRHGNHPDIHTLYPEGKSGQHSMDALREMQKQCALVPLEGPLKCFILYDAERMLPTSANALLKTFEEPQEKTLLIVTTTAPERLLSTIRSRCQLYHFGAPKQTVDPLFDLLFPFLRGQQTYEIALKMEKELQQDKEARLKEAIDSLPKEMTSTQKETKMKEIEGKVALYFQKRMLSLLEACQKIYRDLYIHHMGLDHSLMFFPQEAAEIASVIPKPLETVHTILQEAKLGVLRGLKPASIFQHLAFSLETAGTS